MNKSGESQESEVLIATSSNPLKTWQDLVVPKMLWHYTSLGALQSILDTECIRATDSRFLNDIEESVHAQRFIERELLPSLDDDGPKLLKEHLEKFSFQAPSFVTSFTEAKDRLSQWRGYTHDSVGACIGFDFSTTLFTSENNPYSSPVKLRKCIYSAACKRALLLSIFQPLVSVEEYFNQAQSNYHRDQARIPANEPWKRDRFGKGLRIPAMKKNDAFRDYVFRVSELVPFLKNESFDEEHEWRISVCHSPSGSENLQLKYRARQDSIVPYLELKPPFLPFNITKLISEVMLGPGASDSAISAAASLLKSHDISAPVERSNIPFRTP